MTQKMPLKSSEKEKYVLSGMTKNETWHFSVINVIIA